MSTHTLPLPHAEGATGKDPGTIAAAFRLIRDARDRIAERRRMRQTAAELRGLSDAMLKDIGLNRSEIDYVAFQRGPHRRLVR